MPLFANEEFASRLLEWYAAAKRPLPWRASCTPYDVWISEIMLQQTQMERGVAYFKRWMARFPNIAAVAQASEEDILAAWEGLGYYSRARNLHAAAKTIMQKHGGIFPSTPDAIRALPGIGEYTAGAIASIAFNIPVPAVDANVLRIFSRLLDIDRPVTAKEVKAEVAGTVESLLPLAEPRLLNQALMEFGALICGKKPACAKCPVTGACLALARGTAAARPAGKNKARYARLETVAAIIVRGRNVLIRKRPTGGLWPGLWEFPGGPVDEGESPETALARIVAADFGLNGTAAEKVGVVRHGYTTNRVVMHGYLFEAPPEAMHADGAGCVWAACRKLRDHAFASGHRKLLEKLGWK